MGSSKKTAEHRRLQNRRSAMESRKRRRVWLLLLERFWGWCEDVLDTSHMTADQKVEAFQTYSKFLGSAKDILDNPSISLDEKEESLLSYSVTTPDQTNNSIDLYCYENLDMDMMFV